MYNQFYKSTAYFHSFWCLLCIKSSKFEARKWDKNDKKRLEIAKSILFHIHKHCTASFTSLQPIFTSQQAIFTVLNAANSKREKWYKGVDPPLQGILRPPHALMGPYTPFYRSIPHFTSLQPIFTSQGPIFTVFWSLLCIKSSKFEAGKAAIKWYKRGRSPSTGYIEAPQWLKTSYTLFYKHTAHFYKPTGQYHSFKCSKFEAGKIAAKWYKMARSPPTGYIVAPQCFNGVFQWLKTSYTPFYKHTAHFYKPTGSFHSFKCSKFEAGKAATKWYKRGRSPLQGILRPPNALMGYPNG